MKIKCRLKVILAERDIKHQDFAAKVRVSESNFSLLANSKSFPTLQVAYKISDALDLPVEDIWVRVKDEEKTSE